MLLGVLSSAHRMGRGSFSDPGIERTTLEKESRTVISKEIIKSGETALITTAVRVTSTLALLLQMELND